MSEMLDQNRRTSTGQACDAAVGEEMRRVTTVSPQASGLTGLNDTMNQIPSASNDDYAAYLSIMDYISELSSDDEDLNKAIIASLECNT
ncbi:hypothetical protein Q5P01_007043 [Channa striata]|uniref:Uncharacterized protein n=1 Tax=Channa striata TaxID=64152 RepID=A0AA88SY97_CHASR|nr:hypothetical protein Q5P01_007043 [Channa striata]